MTKSATGKLTLVSLILMIFTSVFGFANMPRGFFLMGYAAIPWYIIAAITYFIPFAFMIAEFGAAFKNEKGGIYSWMEKSVGPRYAFIGIFMWYASYVIWMVNVASTIWIPLSNMIFGHDTTSQWGVFGLSSTQVLGLLGVAWLILVFVLISRGLESIKKVTSIGGSAVALLNIVLLIGGILILILNKGQLAQPIADVTHAFTKSPNGNYQSVVATLSFLTFAIFAFGGTEVVGGLVDQTENPVKTFPKGLLIAAGIISLGYIIGIFMIGIFTNWTSVLSGSGVNTGNVAYIIMQNLGYELGHALGLSEQLSLQIGSWVARFVGLSMFLALSGAFMTLSYSPLKQLIEGTPKRIWPESLTKTKNGLPINAMKVQAIIAIILILLVSFGGESAAKFFDKLVLMTNVAMTIPYLFISIAFISFKRKDEIKKPFVIYKSKTVAIVVAYIVTAVVGFANVFSIVEPLTTGDYDKTLWMMAGPVFFSIIAIVLYSLYERKVIKKS
ncbi:glutamate/gamma-aminobutyrate family transporter YjeM [Turicibacter bilis]|uniref:glutamate/gamma-aminobutyrate family transporter YjeM n=1 Tax=Turicibacter bilis TaxID=2735723 RepID=UPI0006C35F63|nr:glutamate/gamma-aminobutyrate family transporter YjeM [Turicibacter bilis]MBS3203417.1 glutamate/gamma-aminobutyrate family transporter YjeM [Turicibacter bilis]MDY4814163.1 glutamate/gamma-aminobutyrate family transporter YjeM [Turicibacter bilis]UUF10189.1 glutamate/gamma-aminobutyrate family transporter YjeM [Turicibacter bilis]CUN63121.1 Inner membrane transporter yjeM [Turicibacter sanguinis]